MNALVTEHLSDLLGVLYRSAEYYRALAPDILKPRIHNESVALRNIDFTFQIPDIILHTVEANFTQIDVGMNADTSDGHQLSDFHGGLNI